MVDRKPNDLFLERTHGPHLSTLVKKPRHTISREYLPVSAGTWRGRCFAAWLFLICNTRVQRRRQSASGASVPRPCCRTSEKMLKILRHEITAFAEHNGAQQRAFQVASVSAPVLGGEKGQRLGGNADAGVHRKVPQQGLRDLWEILAPFGGIVGDDRNMTCHFTFRDE